MKTFFTILLFIVGISLGLAQQIDLTGQVSIHNSRYRTGEVEYVQDAFIQAPFAGSTNSDSEGLFQLTFQGIKWGETIRLTAEKAGLELVNRQDINEVVLGRLSPLRIYLAPKGKLAEAQVELFNISTEALLKRHNAQIELLRKANAQSDALIQELEQKLNTEISNRFEAEELLNKQLADVQRRLPSMAQELASVNLDFVSDMYRQAYEYLKEGKIDLAIETLDEAVLDAEAERIKEQVAIYRMGLDTLELAKELNLATLDTLIRSQVLQARILVEKEQFAKAAEVFHNGLQNLLYLTPKGEYARFRDYHIAAILALANREEKIACALFEEALAVGILQLPPNPVVYDLETEAIDHYFQLIRSLGQ